MFRVIYLIYNKINIAGWGIYPAMYLLCTRYVNWPSKNRAHYFA